MLWHPACSAKNKQSMARKKRNKSKCINTSKPHLQEIKVRLNTEELSNNTATPELQPQPAAGPKRELVFEDFICTDAPGSGFYVLRDFDANANFPVPVSYHKNMMEDRKKFSTENVSDPVAKENTKSNIKAKHSSEEDSNWPLTFIFLPLLCSFILAIYLFYEMYFGEEATWGLAFVSYPIFAFLMSKLETLLRKIREYASDKISQPIQVSKYLAKDADYEFKTPELLQLDDYYTNEADKALASLDDGIAKMILVNYQEHIKDPETPNEFDADALVDETALNDYGELCDSFTELISDTLVKRIDYYVYGKGDEPEVSFSDASMYAGKFDFIRSIFKIPVIDFGDFRLYFYPSFVIKAYDSFLFEVSDYQDTSFSSYRLKSPYNGPMCRSIKEAERPFMKDRLYWFSRINIEISGGRYSVMCSNTERAEAFVSNLQKFFSKK